MIQIESAKAPFTSPRVAFQAMTALGRADAMGLLPADQHIETLDLPSFRKVVRHIHRAGIARNIQLDLTDASEPGLERTLEHLNLALEESPVPEFEWNRLAEVLGLELLGRLLGISASSVRRYRANARTTPDDVADRLHFLSLVVGDLAGAYNEIGIRQWFERKRAQLDGRTPLDWLKGRWKPAQPGPPAHSTSRASVGRLTRHMILYRHADSRFPFLWEGADQPPARWHGRGEGPVQYLADTPDGAWAEFLRHEGITEESELVNVRRALWAVEAPDGLTAEAPRLAPAVLTGGIETYEECQREARRLRNNGGRALRAPSAALLPGTARGWKVDGGVQPAAERDGNVLVVFGARPELVGWMAAFAARPRSDLLARVRHL
jgi:hypothetical protein